VTVEAPGISPYICFDPEPGYFRYMPSRAERVVRFIEGWCLHTKGRFAGKPFVLKWWQKERIIRPLYGTVQWDDQLGMWRRQYALAWLELARKQGKSEILSALGLYHLAADGEESAEVYGVAADRDQASLVYNVAKRMVELSAGRRVDGQSRDLSKFIECIDSKKRLVYAKKNSFYQVLPGDAAGALGVNASAVLFDEVLTQKDRHLWDAMRQSFGTRTEPLMIAATTASYTTAAFAKAEHDHSLRVQAQPWIDPARFVFARNLPEDWDFRDEGQPPCPRAVEFRQRPGWTARDVFECPDHGSQCPGDEGTGWYYVAPGLGDFFSIETMRAELREAEQRPTALQAFRVFRLNQWVTQTQGWLDLVAWQEGGATPIDQEKLRGRECVGALDLAAVSDFTAWVLAFPGSPDDPGAPGVTVLAHFWLPATALEKRSEMRDQIMAWAEQGYITVTHGETTDYDRIRERIMHDAARFRIRLIGYDPWNATHLIGELEDQGAATVKVPQTVARLNDPSKRLEALVADRELYHGGNPVLSWMASNVEPDITADGLIRPSKRRSGDKIDGISALVTALYVLGVPTEEEREPVQFIPLDGLGDDDIGGDEDLTAYLAAWED